MYIVIIQKENLLFGSFPVRLGLNVFYGWVSEADALEIFVWGRFVRIWVFVYMKV